MTRFDFGFLGRLGLATRSAVICAGIAAFGTAQAAVVGPEPVLVFDTSLSSLNLTGPAIPMPFGAGWSNVDSVARIGLSSQRNQAGPATTGRGCAFQGGLNGGTGLCRQQGNVPLGPINPDALHGQQFFMDSFFDVFFDITLTDVDANNDFAGMPDGASLTLLDNGPAPMDSVYFTVFDKTAPNFGLVPPPEANPYIGHFQLEIPLGADLNGNGENDKVKFTLAVHSVGDTNRSFIVLPDGTVIDQFDSAAFLEGAIVDLSADPPFTIGELNPNTGLPDPGAFGGPTTATSRLQNQFVPEPGTLALMAAGIGFLGWQRRRKAPEGCVSAVTPRDQNGRSSNVVLKRPGKAEEALEVAITNRRGGRRVVGRPPTQMA